MADEFHYLEEPDLVFGMEQRATDPHDGLALFGAVDARLGLPPYIVVGTDVGLTLWQDWQNAMNRPAACEDVARQRPWPPYPGFEIAFGTPWAPPIRRYRLDSTDLLHAARLAEPHERTYAVSNLYLDEVEKVSRIDETPALAICIVPDEVYQNCRPKKYVSEPSDERKSVAERSQLKSILRDRALGQDRLFSESELYSIDDPALEQFAFAVDFRRQIKARVMQYDLPVQIIQEATLTITDEIREGRPGPNPLSDRLWNFGTGVFYKLGRKPWRLDSTRDGVCYVGLSYKRSGSGRTACCAAQMFIDSGDGLVFVGEFGPWYSEERREFHLNRDSARQLLQGVLDTYSAQGGRSLRQVFLHARSGIDDDEFSGFREACPSGVDLVGIRVRKDRSGPRLFRYDKHPVVSKRGMYPVVRGVFWRRTQRQGFLFTSGFKDRIAAYDGWEIPIPLSIRLQHGDADLVSIAKDILALTKANYNACQLGDSEPITIKYSDRVGEILLSHPELDRSIWKHNFKYYI